MSVNLNDECQTEKKIANILKIAAIKEIKRIGFDEASEKLSLSQLTEDQDLKKGIILIGKCNKPSRATSTVPFGVAKGNKN
ncbi:MAG: hypothetical protein UU22_C0002G0008 [Parcubacteria group bacterium GW2011_GWA2_40_8]|nr:MAG: hypothetical protein UU22_C0002G0008 [Parcubacteria group bacterium GW2011_GWA2_40_8]